MDWASVTKQNNPVSMALNFDERKEKRHPKREK